VHAYYRDGNHTSTLEDPGDLRSRNPGGL